MKTVTLGRTGLRTSYLGLGTSAAYNSPLCPAKLRVEDYPELLLFGYEKGITLWDTSLTYGTHSAIRSALQSIPRERVTIISKTVAIGGANAEADCLTALKEMGTDYVDIFLVQCLRGKMDFRLKSGALASLCRLREKGLVRAVGISSHGLGALEAAMVSDCVDIVLGRINYSGHLMDSRDEGLGSLMAGIPAVKAFTKKVLPAAVFRNLAGTVHKDRASDREREEGAKLLSSLHDGGKCVIGMKVLGEGNLAHDLAGATAYVTSLPFITAIVAGCCSIKEIVDFMEAMNASPGYQTGLTNTRS